MSAHDLAARASIPVEVDVREERFPPVVEARAYFVVALLDRLNSRESTRPGASACAVAGGPASGSLAPVEFVRPGGSATKRDAADRRRAGSCIDEPGAGVDELQCERVIASCHTVG
jgi:hypothetical protein